MNGLTGLIAFTFLLAVSMFAQDADISITCSPKCEATSKPLELDNLKAITVKSSAEVQSCSLFLPANWKPKDGAGQEQCHVSHDSPEHMGAYVKLVTDQGSVSIPLFLRHPPQEPFRIVSLQTAAWLAVGIVTLCLFTAVWLTSKVIRSPVKTEEWWRFENKLGTYAERVGKVQASLHFAPVGNASGSAAGAVASDVAKFLSTLDEWIQYARSTPQQIQQSGIELRKLSPYDSRSGEIMETIIRVAIDASDGKLDKERKNSSLQRALKGMIQLAGFTVILPEQFEPYDPTRHKIKETVRSSEDKNTINRVILRGLEKNGLVREKAQVSIFSE